MELSNEVGVASGRGRPSVPRSRAETELTASLGHDVTLPVNAEVTAGPATCPACGGKQVEWGCSDYVTISKEEIHPVIWHETEWMADSFVCRTCNAGWIEPDDPELITWARPYWRTGS